MSQTSLRPLSSSTRALINLYSLTSMIVLIPLAQLFSTMMPKLRRQMQNRRLSNSALTAFAEKRHQKKYGVLVHCSSAGEFEQALTIIRQLQNRDDTYIHIFFHSMSGIKYAKARAETLDYSLAPLDTIGNWQRIFKVLQPNITIVVRYELWPAFLATAYQYGKLILVNASRGPGEKALPKIKQRLLRFFDQIYVVQERDRLAFSTQSEPVIVSGDTKFDRAIERADEQRTNVRVLTEKFNACYGEHFRFIVGSAWKPDALVALTAYVRLFAKFDKPWQLVIAPHDISKDMVDWFWDQTDRFGLTWQLFSKMTPVKTTPRHPPPVVIVDVMGKLAELYGCAHLCMVGGALHNKVHNVLEPAVHGLRLAFGPHYTSQAEAVLLKEANLAQVIVNAQELETWWQANASKISSPHQKILEKIRELSGATKTIIHNLEKVLI